MEAKFANRVEVSTEMTDPNGSGGGFGFWGGVINHPVGLFLAPSKMIYVSLDNFTMYEKSQEGLDEALGRLANRCSKVFLLNLVFIWGPADCPLFQR